MAESANSLLDALGRRQCWCPVSSELRRSFARQMPERGEFRCGQHASPGPRELPADKSFQRARIESDPAHAKAVRRSVRGEARRYFAHIIADQIGMPSGG